MNYQIGKYVGASLDLDSTALWQGELSPINALAAQELDANGLQNVITTGRHLLQSITFYDKLACKGPIITSDGASVINSGRRRPAASFYCEGGISRDSRNSEKNVSIVLVLL